VPHACDDACGPLADRRVDPCGSIEQCTAIRTVQCL